MPASDFVGRWNIYEMDMWSRDAIDMLDPAHIEFTHAGDGSLGFICVTGDFSWTLGKRGKKEVVTFDWEGNDEMDEADGSGWASLAKNGELIGLIAFRGGDKSKFKARRFPK